MPALEFRYFTLRGRHYPFIPIRLHYQDRNVKTYALVVGFSNELVTSFNILGRDDFFVRFRIVFDEAHRKISLES